MGQLTQLVSGGFPDLLLWVDNYGADGAQLVTQPAEIWIHSRSDAVVVEQGGWHVIIPLFTAEESPSDLSAEIVIDADGIAAIEDVHVL